MSVYLTSLVWRADFGTPARKLVALRLADFSNDDGENIFPSVGRVAVETGLDRRTVEKTLAAFRAEGLLHVVEPGGWDGKKNRCTHYRMQVERIEAIAAPRRGPATVPVACRDGVPSSNRDSPGTKPGNPSLEPSKRNPSEESPIDSRLAALGGGSSSDFDLPAEKTRSPASPRSERLSPGTIAPEEGSSSGANSPKETRSLRELVEASYDPDDSDEARFAAAAAVLDKAGVPKGLSWRLVKAIECYGEGIVVLQDVAAARVPKAYLAKIVHKREAEKRERARMDAAVHADPPGMASMPEFAREWARDGYAVEPLDDGKWRCAGVIYDGQGQEIGW